MTRERPELAVNKETTEPNNGSGNPDQRKPDDFVRGADAVAQTLVRLHDGNADVGRKTPPEQLRRVTELAWRPAWSIRSRRGSVRPLIDWLGSLRYHLANYRRHYRRL